MKYSIFSREYKWNKKDVVDFIVECRKDKGIPMFKVKFAGKKFEVNGKPAVLAICWAGFDRVKSRMFYDIPKEDYELIEKSKEDWKLLLEKYGTEKDKEIAYKKKVVIGLG